MIRVVHMPTQERAPLARVRLLHDDTPDAGELDLLDAIERSFDRLADVEDRHADFLDLEARAP